MKLSVVLLLGIVNLAASAADIPLRFEDTDKQSVYENLLEELRCLVCQNQSLADSNADLAQDLRDEVYAMVDAGSAGTDVIEFMVDRYGDFVRYRPPIKATTIMLWGGPFLLLVIGCAVLMRQARAGPASTTLSNDERRRLQNLLGDEEA